MNKIYFKDEKNKIIGYILENINLNCINKIKYKLNTNKLTTPGNYYLESRTINSTVYTLFKTVSCQTFTIKQGKNCYFNNNIIINYNFTIPTHITYINDTNNKITFKKNLIIDGSFINNGIINSNGILINGYLESNKQITDNSTIIISSNGNFKIHGQALWQPCLSGDVNPTCAPGICDITKYACCKPPPDISTHIPFAPCYSDCCNPDCFKNHPEQTSCCKPFLYTKSSCEKCFLAASVEYYISSKQNPPTLKQSSNLCECLTVPKCYDLDTLNTPAQNIYYDVSSNKIINYGQLL